MTFDDSQGDKVWKRVGEAIVALDEDVGGRDASDKVGQAQSWPGGWGDSVSSGHELRA